MNHRNVWCMRRAVAVWGCLFFGPPNCWFPCGFPGNTLNQGYSLYQIWPQVPRCPARSLTLIWACLFAGCPLAGLVESEAFTGEPKSNTLGRKGEGAMGRSETAGQGCAAADATRGALDGDPAAGWALKLTGLFVFHVQRNPR